MNFKLHVVTFSFYRSSIEMSCCFLPSIILYSFSRNGFTQLYVWYALDEKTLPMLRKRSLPFLYLTLLEISTETFESNKYHLACHNFKKMLEQNTEVLFGFNSLENVDSISQLFPSQ